MYVCVCFFLCGAVGEKNSRREKETPATTNAKPRSLFNKMERSPRCEMHGPSNSKQERDREKREEREDRKRKEQIEITHEKRPAVSIRSSCFVLSSSRLLACLLAFAFLRLFFFLLSLRAKKSPPSLHSFVFLSSARGKGGRLHGCRRTAYMHAYRIHPSTPPPLPPSSQNSALSASYFTVLGFFYFPSLASPRPISTTGHPNRETTHR